VNSFIILLFSTPYEADLVKQDKHGVMRNARRILVGKNSVKRQLGKEI
jgi:hypothetical protein